MMLKYHRKLKEPRGYRTWANKQQKVPHVSDKHVIMYVYVYVYVYVGVCVYIYMYIYVHRDLLYMYKGPTYMYHKTNM